MDKIYLEDMVVRFSQEPDCCQENDDMQKIEIHSENNGSGNFFWFKTDRWSFSEPDDLVKLAERIRAMEQTNNKYENGEVIYNNNNNNIKQFEYVDLGLPSDLKWAKCNIGATSESDYGDYFMWGSTTPNTNTTCDWTNAPFNNGSSKYDGTYFNSVKDTVCPNGILAKEYDAASQIMGGDWRMPTKAEIQELIDNTTNEWIEDFNGTGVNGRKFTGSNGNSIFIPALGNRYGGSVYNVDNYGYVWSSSLYTSGPHNAWYLYFNSGSCYMNNRNRYIGWPVRGVMN